MPQGRDKVWWDLPGRTNLKVLDLRTISWVLSRGFSGYIPVVTAFLPLSLSLEPNQAHFQAAEASDLLSSKQTAQPKSEPSTQTQPWLFQEFLQPGPCHQAIKHERALLQGEVQTPAEIQCSCWQSCATPAAGLAVPWL